MDDLANMTSKPAPRAKAPPKPAAPITRGDGLAERLADEITASVFGPGVRLDEVTLAARYGTSRTPVREALRQLEATGLVERRPYRGAVVSAPSPQRLAEMFVAAGEIEANCARLAATAMTATERNGLRKLHDKMGDLARSKNRDAYAEANVNFHEKLYVGAHNATMGGFGRDLRRRLMPFRRAQFQSGDRLAQSFKEHEDIVRAIERGQGDEASTLMRHHMRLVEAAVDNLGMP